ncbi:hypothetical protein GVAV_001116 [Gurleya vavrai]
MSKHYYCSYHKTASHSNKDCFTQNKNRTENKYDKNIKKDYDKNKVQSKPKSLYIKEITPNISLINLDIVAEGKHLKGIFDSGSNFNFINEKFYKTLENVSSKKENIIITTAN